MNTSIENQIYEYKKPKNLERNVCFDRTFVRFNGQRVALKLNSRGKN